jgi:Mn-dependent DtxR family transcriptional regulator
MDQGLRPNPAHDLTRVEDYLEVVYELIQSKGYARSSDIAERLKVKAPSVTSMLQKLHEMRLITYERYRGLTLTENGEKMARSIQQKHLAITKFLQVLGVSEKIARLDAEGIEHHLHRATIERIRRFVEFTNERPSWFEDFLKTLK